MRSGNLARHNFIKLSGVGTWNMRESRIRLLALYAQYTDKFSYFDDWLDALLQYPAFDVVAIDIIPPGARRRIKLAIREVDAVLLLHSTNGDSMTYLERHVPVLANRRVPLITFVGNEVNLPGFTIAGKRRVFKALRPEWIATQLLEEAGKYLFGDIATRGIIPIPHALNPSAFRPTTNPDTRPTDIGSRVMRYIPHLGDNDRNRIADAFVKIGRERGMKVDISNARFNRSGWANFLNLCKGTVSTEAGSWFLEKDDATVEAIRHYVHEHANGIVIANDSKLWKLAHAVPLWLRRGAKRALSAFDVRYETLVNEAQSYADIHARFFKKKPRPPVYGKCISSRHFEAIGTKTCQIMFRGRFNDILKADQHYLALNQDFSNFEDVLVGFSDPTQRRAIVEEAYAHVMDAHTYAHRMHLLHDILLNQRHGTQATARCA
jgi:Glycosyl transferases group 1